MAFHSGEMSSGLELSSRCSLMRQGHLDMAFISRGNGRCLGVTPKSPEISLFWRFFQSLVHYGCGQTFGPSAITFWFDNMSMVHVVNTLSSKSVRVIGLIRAFTLRCSEYNIVFWACHIPGIENELAGALSHQQIDRFRELASDA